MVTRVINGLAVELTGAGRPVLCIHGLGGSSNTWTPLLPTLEGRQVIRFDLAGSARSALPEVSLSLHNHVVETSALLDALLLENTDIVAHCMGATVALLLAARHPQKVRSLILFGPLPYAPDSPVASDLARPGMHARARLARRNVESLQQVADSVIASTLSWQTRERQPAVVALIRECIMRQTPEGYAQSCEALAWAPAVEMGAIRAPVMLITGDQDIVAPPGRVQALAAGMHNAQVSVLKDCGHWPTFEQPGACAQELKRFYRRIAA